MVDIMNFFERGVRHSLEADIRQVRLDNAVEPVSAAVVESVGESRRKAAICFLMDRSGEVPISPDKDMVRINRLLGNLRQLAAV